MSFFIVFELSCSKILAMDSTNELFASPTHITEDNVNNLVLKGIKHISEHGERFEARAGNGLQAYDVSYTLTNPHHRLHTLRQPKAITYFAKELLAYCNGSLKVDDGLSQASSAWKHLANENGEICSNYGYYVFHQRVPEENNITQYEWVIKNLLNNKDSRKSFININQPHHKQFSNKDFPCTLGMQFFIRKNHLCCVVSSRSTDIYTGLPYDMGFFAFVTELVYKDLKEKLTTQEDTNLELGYVTMKTNFTQIYDKTKDSALKLLSSNFTNTDDTDTMPAIENAQEVLSDIYNQTAKTPVMQWIYEHANTTPQSSK